MRFKKSLFVIWALSASFVFADTAVDEVVVSGTVRLDPTYVQEVLDIRSGQLVSEALLNEKLKKLYQTNLFRDVSVRVEGSKLLVSVQEHPTINEIAFEGNSGVREKLLKTKMKLSQRGIYSEDQIKYEVQRLLAIYRAKGFFSARISPKIINRPHNRVDVVFEIDEGDPTRIVAVDFVGNKVVSNWDLSSVITTKESAWWKFFSSDDFYDPDKLEIDREKLRNYYLNRGYVDFRIFSVTAELMTDYKGFIITFNLEEGERYKFGKITLENQIKGLDVQRIQDALTLKEGDWHSAELIETAIEDLTDAVTKQGYSFVEVVPTSQVDEKNKTMGLTFIIKPGPRLFINEINITGNTRTVDEVIRRELSFAEGDPLNFSKLRNSEKRLNYLGFFKDVKLTKSKDPDVPGKVNTEVAVTEQSTGDINFSIGFATSDGPLGIIRVSERNLFGRAYELSTALEMAKRRKSLSADFVNPYLFGRSLALGVGAFWMKVNRDSDSSYTEQSLGTRTWISYFLTENLIQRWSYQISRDIIGTPGRGVYPLIAEDKGHFMTSAVGHEISLDFRDNRFKPTAGYSITLSNEYAGLGGKVKYLKNTLSADYYHKLFEHVVLELHAQAGMMNEIGGRKIRVSDKFMLGGTSLRGFDYSGVGPHGYGDSPANRNAYDESSLGGDTSVILSAQVNFPLGLPEDLAVSGHVFADAGSLWDRKIGRRVAEYNRKNPAAKIGVYNSRKLRSSVGAGISWASPMGVITIDYGHALTHAKGDERRTIIFSMGTSRF